jgi:hypothetical protein
MASSSWEHASGCSAASAHYSVVTAATHYSVITAATQYSEITAATSQRTAADVGTVRSGSKALQATPIRTSGAGKAKRDQLKRKALRQGLPENAFVSTYSTAKQQRKQARAEWDRDNNTVASGSVYPKHFARNFPALHQKKSKKPSKVGQRLYKPAMAKARDQDDDVKFGESACGD